MRGSAPKDISGAQPLLDGFWYKKATNITGRCPGLSFYKKNFDPASG